MLLLKEDFRGAFERIKEGATDADNGCSILMLVAGDVDAICCARILGYFFQQDNVDYKITPVSGYEAIMEKVGAEFEREGSQIRTVIMVNCGASLDVNALLQDLIPPSVAIYILDVYKPVYHRNIHAPNVHVLDLGSLEDLEALLPRDGDSDLEDELVDEFRDSANLADTEDELEGEEEEGGEGGEREGEDEGEEEEDEDGDGEEEGEGAEGGEEHLDEEEGGGEGGEEGEEGGGSKKKRGGGGGKRKKRKGGGGKKGEEGEAAADGDEEEEGGGDGETGGKRKSSSSSSSSSSDSSDSEEGGSVESSGSGGGGGGGGGEGGRRRKRLRRVVGGEGEGGSSSSSSSARPLTRQLPLETLLRRQRRATHRRYTQYYQSGTVKRGTPCAYLAWEFMKAAAATTRRDLLWYAIVGVTSQYLRDRLSLGKYGELHAELRRDVEVMRPVGAGGGAGGGEVSSASAGALGRAGGALASAFSKEGLIEEVPAEPRFVTHRHWTIVESMKASEYVSTRLSTWKPPAPGIPTDLDLLLAHCGCPPALKSTYFHHVSRGEREGFFARLYEAVRTNPTRWHMSEAELFYPSFTRTLDLSEPTMSASDYVYALEGLLADAEAEPPALERMEASAAAAAGAGEEGGGDARAGGGGDHAVQRTPPSRSPHTHWRDTWQTAFQALSRKNTAMLEEGIKKAQGLRRCITGVLPNLYRRGDGKIRAGSHLRWVDVGEDLTDGERRLFSQPLALEELGRYIIRVWRDSIGIWTDVGGGGGGGKKSDGWRRARDGSLKNRNPLLVYLRHKRGSALFGGEGEDDGGWVTILALPVAEEGEDSALKVGLLGAAQKVGAQFSMDAFDSTTMVIRADDMLSFFSELDPRAEVIGVR